MSDALGVFRQIDVNCNEDITLEEFQAWWESGEGGKVAETMRQQRQGDFTVMGLQLNIEQMMDYMELKGLSGHLGLFRELAGKMKAPKNAWQMLPPPAIRGDPTQALRSIAEFSKGKDHAASMGVLFDLLLRNTETLPFPPAIMQRADSVNTPQEQVQLLALYMSLLAQLLKWQGARYQLELDFATFHVAMALEGWAGLDGFGGSRYFSGSAATIIQGIRSPKAAGTITTEQLDLAHQMSKMCDEKKKPPGAGLDGAGGPPPGSEAKLLLSSPFPTLDDYRHRLVKAGLLDATSLQGGGGGGGSGDATRCSFREQTIASYRRTSSLLPDGGAGAISLVRRASVNEPQSLLRSASRAGSRRSLETPRSSSGLDSPLGSSNGRRASVAIAGALRPGSLRSSSRRGSDVLRDEIFLGGSVGSPRIGSRRGTENDFFLDGLTAMRQSSGDLDLLAAEEGGPGSSPGGSGRQAHRRESFLGRIDTSRSLRTMTDTLAGLDGPTASGRGLATSRRQGEESLIQFPADRNAGTFNDVLQRRLSCNVDSQLQASGLGSAGGGGMSPLGGPGGGGNPAAGRMTYSGTTGAGAGLRPSLSRGSFPGRGSVSPAGPVVMQSEVFCTPSPPQLLQQPAPPAASSRLKISNILPNLVPGKKK